MRGRFILTRCRVSFVLCTLLAFLMDAEHASHISIADPPCFLADCLPIREQPI